MGDSLEEHGPGAAEAANSNRVQRTFDATLHGYSQHLDTTILADQTNTQSFQFRFGSVQIQTDPSGATVTDLNGHSLGQTPLQLHDQLVQTLHLVANFPGYEQTVLAAEIQPDQTTVFQTNLTSSAYVQAIQSARQYYSEGNYAQVVQSCQAALAAKPGDANATALLIPATGWVKLGEAKALAANGDYVRADQKLTEAKALLPDNEEIKQLLAD